MKLFGVAAWILLGALASAAPQESLSRIAVELVGPREELRLTTGVVETVLRLSIPEGERRLLELPFVARQGSGAPTPVPRLAEGPPSAGAELLPETLVAGPAWSALPYGLRSRALPPVERPVPRAGALRLSWLAASLILVIALRRRPWAALVLGLVAGLALFVLPAAPRAGSLVRVLEGDATSGRWLEVLGARERLEIEVGFVGWVRRLPQAAGARLEVIEEPGGLRSALVAPGARVYALRESSLRVPTRDDPGAVTLRQVWLRDAAGSWTAHGSWQPREPLPAAVAGPGSPPGWLAAGLPQGLPVLVGELEGAPEVGSASGAGGWLRLVGFE